MLRVQNRAVMAGREIYVNIKGRWTYLYRVVDSKGKTVDFLMRAKRDVAAAKAFSRRAFKTQGRSPRAITPVGYQALHRAAREVLGEHRRSIRTDLQSSKYLEQSHRTGSSIRQTLVGPDAWVQAIPECFDYNRRRRAYEPHQERKLNLGKLRINDQTAPDIWNVVLAA
jgi:transposase-like protein